MNMIRPSIRCSGSEARVARVTSGRDCTLRAMDSACVVDRSPLLDSTDATSSPDALAVAARVMRSRLVLGSVTPACLSMW